MYCSTNKTGGNFTSKQAWGVIAMSGGFVSAYKDIRSMRC